MSTKAKRHIHKYRRVDLSFQKVWACALPDCNHYMPKHMEQMVEGKATICWKCGNETVLGPENMKMDFPQCMECLTGIKTDTIEDNNSIEDIKKRINELMSETK